MRLKEKLKEVQSEKRALLAANFYNLETCQGIVKASAALKQPVILQLTPRSIRYMGLKSASAIARSVMIEEGAECWLHLDHCDDIEIIERCLDEGFDSVMIDASEKDFNDNVRISREVVNKAKPYDVNVEAELGYIPKPGSDVESQKFTEPSDAKRFVKETGVSSLAVAIGTKHGFYKGEPKLDIDRLTKIHESTDAFLVLHGGSGISADLVKQAIRNGITKVNVATETKDIFMRTLNDLMKNSDDIDLRNVFPKAVKEVQHLIEQKIKITAMM